jgi:hypothetical protein
MQGDRQVREAWRESSNEGFSRSCDTRSELAIAGFRPTPTTWRIGSGIRRAHSLCVMALLRLALLIVCAGPLAATGCAVAELQADQDKIRTTLLDLYTNQIMDNLIRAGNGMPIIQLDYTNATATITLSETASLNDCYSAGDTNALTLLTGPSLAIGKSALNVLSNNLGTSHSNQVALTATPVTNCNEVYDAYLEFLALPGSLRCTKNPPPEGVAHICKKCGELYYWVPAEYKKQFLGLALATTAQRKQGLGLPPIEYYDTKLLEITSPIAELKDGKGTIAVRFDRKVPNDSGWLEFSMDKKTYSLYVSPYIPSDTARPAETDILVVGFDRRGLPKKIKTPSDLGLPLDVKLYLRHYRPVVHRTTADLLNNVTFQLQQIQFNQLRNGP